mgnify:CR=1 FL=1
MSAGALVVTIASGMDLAGIARTAWDTLRSLQTISILGTMLLVMALESLMTRYGLIDRLIASLGKLIPDRRAHMMILPAFMGLLPSAGGALLSCPMVDKASDGSGMSPEQKAFTNFWFRHIMEFIAPVYTALIILTQLTELPMASVLRPLLPMAAIATLAGLPVSFARARKAKPAARAKAADEKAAGFRGALKDLALSFAPIVVVLVLVIAFGLSPMVALLPVILALVVIFRPTAKDFKEMAVKVLNPGIITMVLGIMFYKEALSASGGISALADAFTRLGLPMRAMIVALPFSVGLLTGMSSVTMALALPILISMYGLGAMTPHVAALAYVGCNMGMNLTPTHLCLVLTVGYFKVDLIKVIGMIFIPAMVTLAAALLILA